MKSREKGGSISVCIGTLFVPVIHYPLVQTFLPATKIQHVKLTFTIIEAFFLLPVESEVKGT